MSCCSMRAVSEAIKGGGLHFVAGGDWVLVVGFV